MGPEAMRRIERVLWIWTGGEVLVLLSLGWLLWGSLFGDSTFLAGVSRSLRLAGLAFVSFQLLVPLVVFLDLRHRSEDPQYMWVHVSAMPVLNVFGLVGYLEERRRGRRVEAADDR